MCKTIERSVKLSEKKINLSFTALTASDVECVAVFLTSSVTQGMDKHLTCTTATYKTMGFTYYIENYIHCSKDITIDKLVLGVQWPNNTILLLDQ